MIKSLVNKENFLPALGLICVLAYFLTAVFLRLDSAFFVDYDDVFKGVFIRNLIDLLVLQKFEFLPPTWRCPDIYMHCSYIGQVPQYFAAVLVFLFSDSLGPLLAFRLSSVLFGAGILLCVFFVLRRICSSGMALWTVFFLGTNSMFIQSVKHGFWREEIFQIQGLWLGVLCLVIGVKANKNRWVVLGMFIFGVTLWAKMMFPGYIIGAVAGSLALALSGYSLRRQLAFFSFSKGWISVVAFSVGCFPLLFYNFVLLKNATAAAMLAPVLKYRDTGITERLNWFLLNLFSRCNDVFDYTATMLFRDDYGFGWFSCIFTWCAVVWCLALIFLIPVNSLRRRFLVFIFASYSVLTFLTAFIVRVYSSEHIIIIIPFMEMVCAVFVVDMFERIKKPFVVFVLSVFIVAGWSYGHVRYEYTRYLNKDSRKGYLLRDFLMQDMNIILADLADKNVMNICSVHAFYGPLKFFAHDLKVVEGLEALRQLWAQNAVTQKQVWHVFTDNPDVCEIEKEVQFPVVLESEYISRVGKYEKLYLFRVLKHERDKGQRVKYL